MVVVWRLNQLSSERENVVVAATASSSAGSAVMRLNSSTMRTCRRAPATLLRQARQRPIACTAITATMAITSSRLTNSTPSTTSLRGTIGVRPVRIR